MKLFVIIFTLPFFIFSCSAGSGGGASSSSGPIVATPPAPVIAPALTQPSVKLLQVDSQHLICGSGFSLVMQDNKMNLKVHFDTAQAFTAVFTFYDSSCSASGTVGNTIANYTVGGNYAVTTTSGTLVMTVVSSTMTIFAGEFPSATKKMVDWMNSCADMQGSFSSTQDTSLALSLGPLCYNSNVQSFLFPAVGSTKESTEDMITHFVSLTP